MNNGYEPVIGLEVHVELNTKTKMFCGCSADYFGKQPNTHTCPVCLGLPGALPFINQEAIDKCIKIGLALNCSVNPNSYFERKNYFYPDLPKGYQISQLVAPLNVNGWIEVEGKDGPIKIRINRAHQEEDTGKLTHASGETLVDFNRSGVPLVEIVTEPDFTDSSQIRDYAKKLQQIFRYLGVSNADMERGDMRLEANVSVRKVVEGENIRDENGNLKKEFWPPYRVELKNINSFRFMVAAVEHEIKRQIEALESGEKLHQETRGWNEDKKITFLQRSKEEANDYRYFPEPDLPELRIVESRVNKLKAELPELPAQKIKRWGEEYDLPSKDAVILAEIMELADYFEKAVEAGKSKQITPKQIANQIINKKVDINQINADSLMEEIISKSASQVTDDGEIEKWVNEVVNENSQSVKDYQAGKIAAINALVGGVMRKSGGKANFSKVKEILEKKLQ